MEGKNKVVRGGTKVTPPPYASAQVEPSKIFSGTPIDRLDRSDEDLMLKQSQAALQAA
jgi:hypothetical protein